MGFESGMIPYWGFQWNSQAYLPTSVHRKLTQRTSEETGMHSLADNLALYNDEDRVASKCIGRQCNGNRMASKRQVVFWK
jgi:hypothetical protein